MSTTLLMPYANGALNREALASEMIGGVPQVQSTPIGALGPVAPTSTGLPTTGAFSDFSVELANTSSNPLNFIIGDPWGLVALIGGPYFNPTGCSADGAVKGSGVIPMKTMFGTNPVTLRGVNYQCSSSSLQFAEQFMQITRDSRGGFSGYPINVAVQQRNTAQDTLLLTLDFLTPVLLNDKYALTLRVRAGQTVQLNFTTLLTYSV